MAFTLSFIGYALLKDDEATERWPRRSVSFVVLLSAAGALVVLDNIAWLATTSPLMPSALPVSMLFERSQSYWNGVLLLFTLLALALLWSRRRSVLDLWLIVAMCGLLIELCLIALVGRRYVVGWYAGRAYFLVSSTLVLAILLSETALLYARLARSVVAQSREREARLMTMDVLSASIAHEMNQPLASIVTSTDAASRWLGRPTPDVEEVKAALGQIRNSAYRARDLIGSIRAMVKRDGRNRARLDLNDLVREVLALLGRDLQRNRISVELELDESVAPVKGDRIQLQQVLVNLITNAMEAMMENKRPRILRIKSATHDPNGVMVSVADTGTGNRSGGRQSYFQSAVHDQVQRHGLGPGDLPVDHRGPRRPAVGVVRRRRRLGISIRAAGRHRPVERTGARASAEGMPLIRRAAPPVARPLAPFFSATSRSAAGRSRYR